MRGTVSIRTRARRWFTLRRTRAAASSRSRFLKTADAASYRGLVEIYEGATGARSNVECDALLLDDTAKTDTYPYIQINEKTAHVGHEASVSKLNDEQIFYLQSRGLEEAEAAALIVRGFLEPVAKELPLEYAVELNRLIELEMEGSVG